MGEREKVEGFGALFASRTLAATLPGLAWRSLGERALGCGRWASALTEPSRSYVRSLTRAPLRRSVLLRMRLRGSAEQVEGTETERFEISRGPLPSAREAGSRTEVPAGEPPQPCCEEWM